eukprot:CAMPEP_0172305960 /NCGR_PEP_ID=MMETSP1058-20130122/7151_1 /TAXON_ID=83371 /ORGANISM="Detonula confervacea, Strain CCMP 353" /LENGTH=384 /DNA_ID=CAMNT_0013017721 /DNA_START=226 /DNA_END=1377 /DNA_ORIENTATION=+
MYISTVLTFQLIVVAAIVGSAALFYFGRDSVPITRHIGSKSSKHKWSTSSDNNNNSVTATGVSGGSWKFVNSVSPPYEFTLKGCHSSHPPGGAGTNIDCTKAKQCSTNLTNWIYHDKDNIPYPKFDVDGFRRTMRNKSLVFVGSSLMRQQLHALVWSLGHTENIKWKTTKIENCESYQKCHTDAEDNITMCQQFLATMATKIYHEGNYTLDHSLRGSSGDTSCLLRDGSIDKLAEFDYAFVQSLAWWTSLSKLLDSSTSPRKWVDKMVPIVYYDAINSLLSRLSGRTKTFFVLGHTGTRCNNKTVPEPYNVEDISGRYGWNLSPTLWETALAVIKEEELNVQIVDAREPLMQSVHAHPSRHPKPDCLHFCMNSSAVNMYLDIYW